MNAIAQAIHNVAEGLEEGHGVPGVWRVYAKDGLVWFESIGRGDPAVVVCTVTVEVEE